MVEIIKDLTSDPAAAMSTLLIVFVFIVLPAVYAITGKN